MLPPVLLLDRWMNYMRVPGTTQARPPWLCHRVMLLERGWMATFPSWFFFLSYSWQCPCARSFPRSLEAGGVAKLLPRSQKGF